MPKEVSPVRTSQSFAWPPQRSRSSSDPDKADDSTSTLPTPQVQAQEQLSPQEVHTLNDLLVTWADTPDPELRRSRQNDVAQFNERVMEGTVQQDGKNVIYVSDGDPPQLPPEFTGLRDSTGPAAQARCVIYSPVPDFSLPEHHFWSARVGMQLTPKREELGKIVNCLNHWIDQAIHDPDLYKSRNDTADAFMRQHMNDDIDREHPERYVIHIAQGDIAPELPDELAARVTFMTIEARPQHERPSVVITDPQGQTQPAMPGSPPRREFLPAASPRTSNSSPRSSANLSPSPRGSATERFKAGVSHLFGRRQPLPEIKQVPDPLPASARSGVAADFSARATAHQGPLVPASLVPQHLRRAMTGIQAAIDKLVDPTTFVDSRVAIGSAEDILDLHVRGLTLPNAIKLDLIMDLAHKVSASTLPTEARRQIFWEAQSALGRIQPTSGREIERQEHLLRLLRAS
ncbi:hypothetical protein BH11PSE7_BH11PSE7_19490 [soil metagenome]